MHPVERVRGMLDHPPVEAAQLGRLNQTLLAHFARYGFQQIEAPVLEHSELFQRKLGADINARMYTFTDLGGRRLALRPELTASVLRVFLDSAAGSVLPARLSYSGPVFRYERPQRGRYRQFTQVGVEVIGADAPYADTELLWLAMEVPSVLGLSPARLVIGHLGIVLSFLRALEVDGRTESILLQGLETMKKRSSGYNALLDVLGISENQQQNHLIGASLVPSPDDPRVQAALAQLPRSDAILLVRSLLGSINTAVGGGRDPEEIVDRLLERLRTGNQRPKIERAMSFIQELSALAGPPQRALREAATLLARYHLPEDSLHELEEVCSLLDSLGFPWNTTTIDLSLGRGLQYYTGMVFEIYGNTGGAEDQLCGGGRYDDLALALGARTPVRALGCSWGLERLFLSQSAAGALAHVAPPDAFITPIGETYAYAFLVAQACRRQELRAEIDCISRSASASVNAGTRKQATWLIAVGPEEEQTRSMSVRRLGSTTTRHLQLSDLEQRGRSAFQEE